MENGVEAGRRSRGCLLKPTLSIGLRLLLRGRFQPRCLLTDSPVDKRGRVYPKHPQSGRFEHVRWRYERRDTCWAFLRSSWERKDW